MGDPAEMASAYMRLVNEARLEELIALFAEDAVVVQRAGIFTGRDEIRGFYRDTILPNGPHCRGELFSVNDRQAVLEMWASTALRPDVEAEVLDLFELDDSGAIARLSIYFR